MRRRFILAFVALFGLFAAGIAISLFFIWRGTSELRGVLAAHQIEDLRQDLSRSLQRSRSGLEVAGTVFAQPQEEVIGNLLELDRSIQGCFDCHHEPPLRRELETIAGLVETYSKQHGAFIATPAGTDSRERLQLEAAATADEVDAVVEALLLAAGPRLQRRTEAATAQVERSWISLVVTLLLTFIVAVVISSRLTRSVTRPLDRLVKATGRVGRGELGHRIQHRERHELGDLMDAFNLMSETLESKTRRVESYVDRLHRLNRSVVALYAQATGEELFASQMRAIDGVLDVELRGSIVRTGLRDVFLVSLSRRGETTPEFRTAVSAERLDGARRRGERSLLVVQEDELDGWPFGAWAPPEALRNYLVCWVEWQRRFQGALLAVNKVSGKIETEDGELLIALGQAIGAAMEAAGENKGLQEGLELPQSGDGSPT